MKLSKAQQAIIALIIANFIWGAAAPVFKWSLQNVEPFTLAFLRFAIASLILLPFIFNNVLIKKQDIPKMFLIGFSGVTINIAFFFLAIQITSSINAPIIASSAPLFLMFFGFAILKEKPKLKKILGGILGFLGVLFIVLMPAIEKGLDASLLGNLFLIVAMFGSVWQTILVREFAQKYSSLVLVFWSFIVGTFTFYPLMMMEVVQRGFLTGLDMQGIIGIVYGAVLCSAVAYCLYYFAIKQLPVFEVGMFTYMDPIIAIIIAIPLLNESPTTTYMIGSALVFFGILIAEKRLPYHPFSSLKAAVASAVLFVVSLTKI